MADEVEGLCVAFVDCESTGIGQDDEPISIGVVAVRLDAKGHGEPFAEWYGEQCPTAPIHPAAKRVHGKSRESLEGKKFDVAGLRAVLEQVEILVAHQASFDARMLLRVIPDVLDWEWRCTRRQWPWPVMQNKKLDSVCAHFGLERPATHDALADAHVLRMAVMQRTGKTERSRTYMHKLLSRGECDVRPRGRRETSAWGREPVHVVARPSERPSWERFAKEPLPPQPPEHRWEPPARPKRPALWPWIILTVLGLFLIRACST